MLKIINKIKSLFHKKEEIEVEKPVVKDNSFITEEYLDNYSRRISFRKDKGEWEGESFVGEAYRKYDDFVVFDEEQAIKELIDGLFISPTDDYEENPNHGILIALNANDFFYWACADDEVLPLRFLRFIYDCTVNNIDGESILLCYLRKQQPQKPVKDNMIRRGAWLDWLEKYPIYES